MVVSPLFAGGAVSGCVPPLRKQPTIGLASPINADDPCTGEPCMICVSIANRGAKYDEVSFTCFTAVGVGIALPN